MHHYRSSRGNAIEWRQSGDATTTSTIRPSVNYRLNSRGRTARLDSVLRSTANPAITLVAANSTASSISSTGTIIQTHILAGDNSSATNSCSSAAITQTHVLVGANNTATNSCTSGTITQNQVLVGSNSNQLNLSSSVSLSNTEITLTVSTCIQSATSSTGQIVKIHNLIAANCVQNNYSTIYVPKLVYGHFINTNASTKITHYICSKKECQFLL